MKARNRIKPLLTLCCALLLVAAGVFGTLAYLTGTDTVNNTFTVGNVKITLDEAKVTTDGTPVEGADRVKANEYHLLPGHTYTKDPTVTVKASADQPTGILSAMLVDLAPDGGMQAVMLEQYGEGVATETVEPGAVWQGGGLAAKDLEQFALTQTDSKIITRGWMDIQNRTSFYKQAAYFPTK